LPIARSPFPVVAGLLALAMSIPAHAQEDDGDVDGPVTISRAVVQRIPGKDSMTLNEALTRLGKDPRDVPALIDAGNAALAMGDIEAATGFFRRADQISPGNPRIKAGLAGAMVKSGNPFEAIPLFQEAERASASR
jgi:Flp pilus assembly protein TadD